MSAIESRPQGIITILENQSCIMAALTVLLMDPFGDVRTVAALKLQSRIEATERQVEDIRSDR